MDNEGKFGFKNVEGKIVIPAKYQFASDFAENKSAVQLNNKWGFINDKGKILINFLYESAQDFSEGLAPV